ncbi:hypothetical protein PQD73_gp063 [Stenotrophomonas phage Salva]|uniref:Uncharacterized protein n=1 Tax=Stenotrophomonas phage Salva TaxID=2801524 RepID=A0A8B6Q872_9CAUD|nr:hypothetical protein PQD73_gp063 [Stenotrophomonas phage Salva]QQM18227.1 hypothetical protein CPT_Salva_063 [Stenotrophomonas phage Salva]
MMVGLQPYYVPCPVQIKLGVWRTLDNHCFRLSYRPFTAPYLAREHARVTIFTGKLLLSTLCRLDTPSRGKGTKL